MQRVARWQRTTLHLSGALLLLSGAAWLALHHLLGAGAGELPHPMEAWSLRVHGLAAFAGLFALGSIAASHIPHGWRASARQRRARQRATGLLLCGLAAALVLTGYALYYFAPETVRPSLGWLHAGIGVAMAALLCLHRPSNR
jgi:hypothetical protein